MADLREHQEKFAALRAQGRSAGDEARGLSLRATRLKERLAGLGQSGSRGEAQRLAREIANLEEKAAAARGRHEAIAGELNAGLAGFVREQVDVFSSLDDHRPFLLFPVRLETKFDHGGDELSLRVRIFPDAINVSTHDPLLSAPEREAGLAYWADRARALALTGDEKRQAEHGAWTILATRYRGPRARYIARQTKPDPWPPQSPATLQPAAEPPDEEAVRMSHSAAPPRARLLPDRFLVFGLDGNDKIVASAEGALIPDDLMLGPDPENIVAELQRNPAGRLAADPKLAWLINFDKALEAGMAVRLEVPPEQARIGFKRLIAIGAKLSMSPEAGAAALEALLGEHRFTGGIDLLRSGSPTNNTDGAPSAFTSDLAADEALAAQEVDGLSAANVTDHAGKSDAQRLSEALGIQFDTLRDLPNSADAHDMADALAMNRALWPATIGRFLDELMGKSIDQALKRSVERFFLTYVTGRTLLPNLRVGRQPYAVLASGDLKAWTDGPGTEAGREGDDEHIETIAAAIDWFRKRFERLAPPRQMGAGGDNALANSMLVIGQLASSAAFASRKAVTDEAAWNTLNFTGVIPFIALNWWDERVAERNATFSSVPLDISSLPLADLVFFHDANPLSLPVVDQDPAVPLSEDGRLSLFDGTRNYIDWLLSASTDELRSETFKDADGGKLAPPRALLYRMLHNAWTSQLVRSSTDLFSRLHPGLASSALSSALTNIGETKIVPESEAPMFDAAKLGLATQPRSLGDHLLDASRAFSPHLLDQAPEALPIQSQRSALERLSRLSTAALECLFAEHVDLASYRLDAWQSGLVARRLDGMRRRRGGERGLYLGAYGYVENLVPKPPPRAVGLEDIPVRLRDSAPVLEQQGNGGFVHAPSLTHAVTAAVLRNAYLTHAEPGTRDTMSVNLTSRRVRDAMALVEGVRAGQDLSALLGYQFERGLHERYPGLELDTYIYILRERFPLVSRRLTPVPDGTPAEVVEARNVIDGKDLVDHVRANESYPHGLAGLATLGTREADAIIAELGRLEEAMDAVADLMLAESVHQAVQSNIDRARGVVRAMGEGEIPPEPDVIQTPRSGRVYTQRIALPLPSGGPGWLTMPTPRAAANAGLNAWLATRLPAAADIGFSVSAPGAAAETVTLDTSALEPIDLIATSSDRFGDGSSSLERYLADRWRSANAVSDDVATVFSREPPTAGEDRLLIDLQSASGAMPLGRLLPVLRTLRRLLGGTRGLTGQDLALSEDSKTADPANPKGYKLDGEDIAELPARCASAQGRLITLHSALQTRLDALESEYEAVKAKPATFNAGAWTGPLDGLRGTLRAAFLFGTSEALPRSASGTTLSAALALYEQGRAIAASLANRLDAAALALAPLPPEPPVADPAEESRRRASRLETRLDNLAGAAHLLLGANFAIQPLFELSAAARARIEARLADPIEDDPLKIESWLQSLSRVRPRVSDLALTVASSTWLGTEEPLLVPVQLPLRAGDPWIGQAWSTPPADGEILSIMTVGATPSLAGGLAGIVVDEWTEVIPTVNETTGLAFHFDRPSAVAPQALLLATPSSANGRWRSDELLGTVIDTVDRAKLRAIEPDHVLQSGLFPILPATLSSFSHGSRLASTLLVRDVLTFNLSPE